MTKAKLLLRFKQTDNDGDIIEKVLWQVPVGPYQPQGVRYRLAFIPRGERRPAVLYDNHHPKGHHKHVGATEMPIVFHGWQRMVAAFDEDVASVKAAKRKTHEGH